MSNFSSVTIGFPSQNVPPTNGPTARGFADASSPGATAERRGHAPGHEYPKDILSPVTISAAQAEEALAIAEAIGALFPQPLDVFERVRIAQPSDTYQAYSAQRRAALTS